MLSSSDKRRSSKSLKKEKSLKDKDKKKEKDKSKDKSKDKDKDKDKKSKRKLEKSVTIRSSKDEGPLMPKKDKSSSVRTLKINRKKSTRHEPAPSHEALMEEWNALLVRDNDISSISFSIIFVLLRMTCKLIQSKGRRWKI